MPESLSVAFAPPSAARKSDVGDGRDLCDKSLGGESHPVRVTFVTYVTFVTLVTSYARSQALLQLLQNGRVLEC